MIEQSINEKHIFIFLVQVFLLLGISRLLGEILRKWKQPQFTAEILTGIILGPTILGHLLPKAFNVIFPVNFTQQHMLETVSWLGLLFLLLNTGLEVDFSSAWRQRGEAFIIAISDIIIPISLSFIACLYIPNELLVNHNQRYIFALFMATVMSISAMPVTVRALHDLKLSKTDLNFLIISALSINDIIGWIIFTLVLGLFTHTSLSFMNIFLMISAAIGFAYLCLAYGRDIVDSFILKAQKRGMSEPSTSLTFICLLGLICGAITQLIGIHALFGFFLAGIMAGSAKTLSEKTRSVISQMVYAIFVPLFFTSIGLKIDILKNFNLFLTLYIFIFSLGGKFLGAWLGAGFTKLSKSDRFTVAISHIPGGSIEIVIGLLALEYKLVSQSIFIAIVFSAIASSIVFGPLLSFSIRKRRSVQILDFISRRAIVPEIRTTNRDEALLRLSERAADLEDVADSEIIYRPVLQRESVMGTALEEGVAVPHARVPSIKMPLIIFGRSLAGIEWDSPDGKPAQFIFLILTPIDDNESQVQILSSIAKIMSDIDLRREIIKAEDIDKIWTALHKSLILQEIVKK